MGGLFDPAAYSFSPLSVPYLTLTALLVVFAGYLLFTHGNPLQRMPLLAATTAGIAFAVGQAAAASCRDPEVARRLYTIAIGPVAIVGPAVFALQMAVHDQLHQRRALLAIALVGALASVLVTFTTRLVIAGVWRTRWGMYYNEAGPLLELHLANMVCWAVAGGVITARKMSRSGGTYLRARYIRLVVVMVLLALASSDALLAHHIGVYPLSWLPTVLAMGVVLATLRKIDFMRRRGRDTATIFEVGVVVALALLAFAAMELIGGLAAVLVLVAALVGAQLATSAIRRRHEHRRTRLGAEAERALDEFVEFASTNRDPDALADAVATLLSERIELPAPRLLSADDGELARRLDVRVKAWVLANPRPLIWERLSAAPLGGLRAPIEAFFHGMGAEVILPLVDRQQLVGVVVSGERPDGRALTDAELRFLSQVQESTGRALTYIGLYREAEERVEVAREVEIAAAVQHGRSASDERRSYGDCSIISHYLPAGQFGGDWWSSAELSDGRVLVMIGDVTGHGVPAALVTATVEGCCETAQSMLGGGFNVLDLMQLLNRSVLDVGQSRYLMSCFAAVLDLDDMTVTYANAGHPFPYLCRRDELRALVSRGTPLGIEATPVISAARAALRGGDLLVFYTDALVESESEAGARYGERRLQRVLKRRAAAAGERALELILDDARVHYGDRPIREDITLLCVHLGGAAAS